MSFPRYPKYKDSGVEWLGEVPAHWAVVPIKAVATCNDDVLEEKTPDDFEIDYVEISDVDAVAGITGRTTVPFGSAPSRARRRVSDGDVLVSTVRTYLRAIAQVKGDPGNMIASTGFAVIRPRKVHSGYLGYACCAEYLISEVIARSVGVSYPAINASDLMRLQIPVPTVDEQRTVSEFLDSELLKIDGLVAEQEKLIALLKEKRQAVISHAVTKGLDPNVPMKDSGIEWLGEVPAHWRVEQSRRLFRVRSERARDGDKMLTASQKHGVLYQSDFVEMEGRRVVEVIKGADSLLHAEPNDFVISMRSFQGGIEWCRLRGSISFHYVMVVPVKHVHPPFFSYLLKSMPYIQALRSTTDLIRDGQELRYSHFVQVQLPVVPMEEQAKIADFLGDEMAKIDSLIGEAGRAVVLLGERRSALISAAVTGKIDVHKVV